MKIETIDTGYFHADGGAMFGATPKVAWSRRYPSDEANTCVLAMRSLLVTDIPGRVIVVDCGAGDKHLGQLSYYRFFDMKDLGEELKKRGIMPEQVTDVVLTHLHFDHCGYVTLRDAAAGNLRMAFPSATHWVSRPQWENFLHPGALEKDSYFMEDMQMVADLGLLRLIGEDTELCPGVELRLFDGHTPGQIVPYFHTPGHSLVFAGDVIPLAASVSPLWISAYDTYPVSSYSEKMRLLDEAASKEQTIVYCHDAYTTSSKVKKVNDFFVASRPGASEG